LISARSPLSMVFRSFRNSQVKMTTDIQPARQSPSPRPAQLSCKRPGPSD
jgi:hypothetical protein